MTGRSGEAKSDEVPRALRCWFVVHGVVDWMFAVPLFLFPDAFWRALGWTVVDPMAARGVAPALVGIGTQSLLSQQLDRPGLPRAAVAQGVGLEKDKAAMLGVLAGLRDGRKVILAVERGHRESTESWGALLRDLQRRGLRAPRVVVGDGHLGTWGALAAGGGTGGNRAVVPANGVRTQAPV